MSYYEDIVKQGFFIDKNRKSLEDYFFTIFHLETKYPSPQKFFRGCLKVTGKWEKDIFEQWDSMDTNLNLMIIDKDPQISDEMKEDCKKQLSTLKKTDFKFTIDNLPVGMKGSYDISLKEIDLIKDAIYKAFKRCKNDIGNPKYQHKNPKPKLSNGKRLSVSDWAIIFYYLYEAGEKKEAKTKGFKKIIKDNNIETTPNSFHNKYYKIVRRINQTENKKGETLPPLPPERIKKILPFLENNIKAKRNAENDIDYLTNEVQEHNDNDY